MKERINAYISAFLSIVKIFSFWIILFFIARVMFLLSFGKELVFSEYIYDLFKAFIMGFRTDTMSISYFLILPFALSFGFFLVSVKNILFYRKIFNKILLWYGIIFTLIIVLGIIADYYYFSFFADHLNILVFDLFKDDTSTVLKSMWTDYPFIKIVLFLIAVFLISRFTIKRISKTEVHIIKNQGKFKTLILSVFIVLSSMILLFTGMRNSWGTFPLRMENTGVSDNLFINKVGLNSFFCLQNAISAFHKQSVNTDIEKSIRKSGFSSIDEISDAYLGTKELIVKTPYNEFLEKSPPNVVLVMMESMSQFLMEFHSTKLNLLGELEDVLPNCYFFKNFMAADNSTISSLEEILFSSPLHPISQSTYREKELSSSITLPFKDKGYQTYFFTGARLNWRNLENYLPKQFFDIVEGEKAIEKLISGSSKSEWGLYDEFVFDRAFNKLAENTAQQKFIYIMTTTNHTPYGVPFEYKPYPLTMDKIFKERLKINPVIAEKQLITFQYANHYLGKFLKRIISSDLGDNTIVVITGDHSRPNLINFSKGDFYKNYTVPLIIYVPEKYRPKHVVDTTRFGSHKDIFPSIFNLSLSKAKYINSGNNLLTTNTDTTYFFGLNHNNFGLSKDGALYVKENLYYTWKNSGFEELELFNDSISFELEKLNKKVRSRTAIMEVFIKNELKNE